MSRALYKIIFINVLVISSFMVGNMIADETINLDNYHLDTLSKIKEVNVKETGTAWVVDKGNFPVLEGITCFTLELWDESMRIPHWHPNASELGYVVSGEVQIIIWRSPGETAVFNLSEGMCWFIPQGSLHSLNNIGEQKAELLVAFSSAQPQDIDLPVAFNGVPVAVRNAYTSPHADLKNWVGPTTNPLVGKFTPTKGLDEQFTGSPYKFDLATVPPLFNDKTMGSVVWGIKDNWNILKDLSVLRAHLKPGIARDAIWYPDAGTLYVVSKGKGQFHIIMANSTPKPINVKKFDYIFVPQGTLHTFINTTQEDFEVVAFFNNDNPLPEVSLSVSTGFFPKPIIKQALTEYGNIKTDGDPLKDLQPLQVSPYLLKTQ